MRADGEVNSVRQIDKNEDMSPDLKLLNLKPFNDGINGKCCTPGSSRSLVLSDAKVPQRLLAAEIRETKPGTDFSDLPYLACLIN
jgi:hypothetical protein